MKSTNNKNSRKYSWTKRIALLLTTLVIVFVSIIIPINTTSAKVIPGNIMDIFNKGIRRLDADGTTDSGSSNNCVTDGSNVTWIGDSISEQSSSVILNKLPGVNLHAMSSKKFAEDITSTNNKSGLTIMRELGDSLRNYVVLALGTNPLGGGGVQQSYINDALNIMDENHKLVLVTNYEVGTTRFNGNNTIIKNAASDSRVSVADWETVALNNVASDGTNSYMSDGVHLSGIGIPVFVDTIISALGSSSSGSDGGGPPEGISETDSVYTTIRDSANAKTIYQYLRGQGLDALHTAAIMGNMYRESGFNPRDVPEYDCGGYRCGGLGIVQWFAPGRRTPVYAYAGENLNLQLDSVWAEMTGQGPASGSVPMLSGFSYDTFLGYSDIEEATWYFNRYYEVSADGRDSDGFAIRLKAARIVLSLWGDSIC